MKKFTLEENLMILQSVISRFVFGSPTTKQKNSKYLKSLIDRVHNQLYYKSKKTKKTYGGK